MGYNKAKSHRSSSTTGKSRDVSPKRKLGFGDYRFVRIELLTSEKDQFKADVEAGDWTAPDMDEYLGKGYTLKFSSDPRGSGRLCTITCTDVESGDAGLQLTGRGSTAAAAYSVAAYKDFVICGDRSWLEAEHERGGSYDDIG